MLGEEGKERKPSFGQRQLSTATEHALQTATEHVLVRTCLTHCYRACVCVRRRNYGWIASIPGAKKNALPCIIISTGGLILCARIARHRRSLNKEVRRVRFLLSHRPPRCQVPKPRYLSEDPRSPGAHDLSDDSRGQGRGEGETII